jgi:c-di-GMP-binding flagellar brake protein YcgR
MQVGEGGMSLVSEFAFRESDSVILTFQIPDGSLVCVRAQVRYTKSEEVKDDAAIGFEFAKLEFHFKRELRNFVARATQESITL